MTAPTRALPEGTTYRDDGCKHHPSCLTCPFAECALDVPLAVQRANAQRAKVRALRAEGLTLDVVAARMGISLRQAYRLATDSVPQRRRRVREGDQPSKSAILREELPRRFPPGVPLPYGAAKAIAKEFDCPESLVSAIRAELRMAGGLDMPLRRFARLPR